MAKPSRGSGQAAGETACVSVNGANRLGSNSLPECLVFGAQAGRAAAQYAVSAASAEPTAPVRAQVADERRRLDGLLDRDDGREFGTRGDRSTGPRAIVL